MTRAHKMSKKTWHSVIAALVLSALAACGSPAAPTAPAHPPPTSVPTSAPTPSPTAAPLTGQLIFAAQRDGRWDLYAASPRGGAWQLLTNDGASRAPALTRGGAQIAFESHRDGNWEIYSMPADGSRVTRLTRDLAYDGEPAWSPDGKQIAFASTRQTDLDIWVMNADGTHPRDLTEKSPAADFAPAWSPDGQWIAFTSWQTGTAQIFILSPDGKQIINLSQNKFDDQTPAWSPDGKQIAFVSDRDGQRAIYVADFSTAGLQNARRVTYSGWDDHPAWSPDGKFIAFTSARPTRQPVYIVPANGGTLRARALDNGTMQIQSVAWTSTAAPIAANRAPALPDAPSKPLNTYPPPPASADLVPLKDVYLAPSWGQMSNQVSGSFEALRARVKAAAGWDFLGTLSDMTRQLVVGQCGDGCDVLSWHKSGRAVDTRLEVDRAGMSMIEIVREDQLGETYWRIYLRAAVQDGTLGEPLTEPPWDWTHQARWQIAPYQGGIKKPIPTGYYIDFTELAQQYGWQRISSYDDPTLSWKTDATAMEFWHYQKTDGLVWYNALRELYSKQTLAQAFDWNALLSQKHDEYLLSLKGLPAPPSAWKWAALGP